MEIKVAATRMELMNLKKRVKLAYKGHKLLKDKQDQLVREFFSIIDSYKTLRKYVEQKLKKAYAAMILTRSVMNDAELENALFLPVKKGKTFRKIKKCNVCKNPSI